MENKHTPGPWVIEESHDIIWLGTPKQGADGYAKMDEIILHINQDAEYKTEKKEKNRANAKLISAAPQLLDALKRVLAHAEFIINSNHVDHKAAMEAIKKATE